jgi:tRNA modification GTPase
MNALLGKERAIVTNIAGTTRDLIEEDLKFGGFHFRLIDTAGIRETEEVIEQIGIRRSQKAMKEADLILLVLDASRDLSENDKALIHSVPLEKTIIVWNKIDLAKPPLSFESEVFVSAQKGIGLDDLRKAIEKKIWKEGAPDKEEVVLTQLRHYEALVRAIGFSRAAIDSLKNGISPEFTTSDLRAALQELGTIIGANVTEDILSAIFSKFCLGK